MRIERVRVDRLVPYARNSRTHSEAQVAQLEASIREFGFTNPVLIDAGGEIIAGHGRVLAARKLEISSVPCIRLKHLTEEQKRAYAIADNKLALNAGWDMALLSAELHDLDGKIDLELTGFVGDDLAAVLEWAPDGIKAGLTDPDDAPAAPAKPRSKPGDIWILGVHRLLCGDATNAEDVGKLLAGVKPHLMVTDPPYGVEYDPASSRHDEVARSRGAVLNDDKADWREAWALFPGDVAYVWHADLRAKQVVEGLEAAGFVCRAQIIWDKTRPVMSRGHYHFQHEPCWYAVRKGSTAHWAGDRKQSTVWPVLHQRSDTGHGTQKPVEAMRRPMQNNSSIGQAVYDPFVGSGTSIIAAEQIGRCCYAIELDPAYVDVVVKRWQDFTGSSAVREFDRVPFDEVAS